MAQSCLAASRRNGCRARSCDRSRPQSCQQVERDRGTVGGQDELARWKPSMDLAEQLTRPHGQGLVAAPPLLGVALGILSQSPGPLQTLADLVGAREVVHLEDGLAVMPVVIVAVVVAYVVRARITPAKPEPARR